jgi:RNA polymerase sigma-70 factor (ECF subfamily)
MRPVSAHVRAPETEEERALANGCRAGDRAALDRFFRDYVRRVERVLGRVVGPTPDLEDLVQATFVEALRSFARYRGEASMATWVTRIAVHVAHHHLRRGVRRVLPLELVPEEPSSPGAPPDDELDARRLQARLHRLLDRVKPKKRIAFVLYVVEGHSVEEVAALMGASRTATKSRLFFARRELQAMVKRDPVLRARALSLLGEEG